MNTQQLEALAISEGNRYGVCTQSNSSLWIGALPGCSLTYAEAVNLAT